MIYELLKKHFPDEFARVLRRFLAIGLFAAVSAIAAEMGNMSPEYAVLLTAIIAGLDKFLREYK